MKLTLNELLLSNKKTLCLKVKNKLITVVDYVLLIKKKHDIKMCKKLKKKLQIKKNIINLKIYEFI